MFFLWVTTSAVDFNTVSNYGVCLRKTVKNKHVLTNFSRALGYTRCLMMIDKESRENDKFINEVSCGAVNQLRNSVIRLQTLRIVKQFFVSKTIDVLIAMTSTNSRKTAPTVTAVAATEAMTVLPLASWIFNFTCIISVVAVVWQTSRKHTVISVRALEPCGTSIRCGRSNLIL